MKFTLMAGSLRNASLNKKLLNVITQIIEKNKLGTVVVADLKSLALPVYDGDIEAEGMPVGAIKLGELIEDCDALISCSPEYNGSMSSPLKNAIDWASRLKTNPLAGKPVLLTGASPGGLGAIRGLAHSRVPFDSLGCYVNPQTFGLARAHEAFNESGMLVDEKTYQRLESLVTQFSQFAQKI